MSIHINDLKDELKILVNYTMTIWNY
jgi:hypothetical protein